MFISLFIIIIIVCITIALLNGFIFREVSTELFPPNPEKDFPPSPSIMHTFNKGAVCSDAAPCSNIGRDILTKNGSAVDAAIATMFCNGIVNMQSMGLGGGFLMTIYTRENKEAITLNARETAPMNATADMFDKDPEKSKRGPLAVGVPGELRGYVTAYKRFGKLPWRDLIQPSINLCENGYNMSKAQYDSLSDHIKDDELLNKWFVNSTTGELKKRGSLIQPKKYCETLRLIAEHGGDILYNGTLADKLVEDIQEKGGIITKEDLLNYKAIWSDAIHVKLHQDNLYSVPPPGSGVLLGFILNVLKGYNFTSDDINGINNTVLTYHKIIETFKYAYAKRTELGDPNFNNITELLQNLTSNDYAEAIRDRITENSTFSDPAHYGAVFYAKGNHGTAHISILTPNGDAVSVTSTVNLYFGAEFTSKQTGIILNSGMNDFSSSAFKNYFGLPGSPANHIEPQKRPLSSMSPTIITDEKGDVKLVIGASGGTKITSAMALVIMRSFWLGQTIKQAVDAPRIHHQVFPMEINYEYGVLKQIVDG